MENGTDKFPIYHVRFKNQYAITSTLLRFQEHYESPEFRGRVFDLELYMDWYAKTYQKFDYYTKWNGFNFPSYVFAPFQRGGFGDLTRKERRFLDLFTGVHGDFYVIGTHGESDAKFLSHEGVHGLFYTDKAYAAHVLATLKGFALTEFRTTLAGEYHPDVIEDECNAHLTTGPSAYLVGKSADEVPAATAALIDVFRGHFGQDPSTDEGRAWLISKFHEREFVLP